MVIHPNDYQVASLMLKYRRANLTSSEPRYLAHFSANASLPFLMLVYLLTMECYSGITYHNANSRCVLLAGNYKKKKLPHQFPTQLFVPHSVMHDTIQNSDGSSTTNPQNRVPSSGHRNNSIIWHTINMVRLQHDRLGDISLV